MSKYRKQRGPVFRVTEPSSGYCQENCVTGSILKLFNISIDN